jgi:hypothetical protein
MIVSTLLAVAAAVQTPGTDGWTQVIGTYVRTIPAQGEVQIPQDCNDAHLLARSGGYDIRMGRESVRAVAVYPGNPRAWVFVFSNGSERQVHALLLLYLMCEPEVHLPTR